MGRRPKSIYRQRLSGNPGKRSLSNNEPIAVAGLPRCPPHLKGEARREWYRIGKQLVSEKRMALLFKAVLAAYCSAWGRWTEAEAHLHEHGPVITTPTKFMRSSPWLAISNTAQSQMMKCISELGISPTSQANASEVKHSATVTRFEAFLGGKMDSE